MRLAACIVLLGLLHGCGKFHDGFLGAHTADAGAAQKDGASDGSMQDPFDDEEEDENNVNQEQSR